MKANELMVGDWVLAPETEEHTAYNEGVVALVNEHGYVEVTIAGGECGYNIDELKSIPLTLEILEKNGFEPIENKVVDEAYIFDRNEFEEPDIIIRRFDFNDSFVLCTVMDNTAIISIAYVHQLQHALRLCGIEKEITL